MIKIQGTLSDIEATILNCVIDPSAINIEFKNIEFNCESITDSKGRVFEKVKHGRWEIGNILDYASRPTGRKVGKCSVCGKLTPEWRRMTDYHNWQYCPNCGTKMDEVTE